jgi:predicted nucleotidyltransferase
MSKEIFDKNMKKNPNVKEFLENLSMYINEKIYVFGSFLRPDYNSKSDVDICIFTNNLNSLKVKLQHFLVTDKKNFQQVFWRLPHSRRLCIGYKIIYKNKIKNIIVEICLYNEKFKEEILKEHYSKNILPFYITFLFYIIKFLYYDIGLLNKKYYIYLKKLIFNYLIDKKKTEFLVL